ARADRAGLPVPRVAVRAGAPVEAVAMHHALEAAALADAGDLHLLAGGEGLDGDDAAGLRRLAAQGEFAQHARRVLDARLRGVHALRLRGALGLQRLEAELHAVRAGGLGRADLHDGARPRLDHGHRGHLAVLGEQLDHPQLASDDYLP